MEKSRQRISQVACLLFKPGFQVRTFAEACFRFSSKVAVREGEAVFIETGKSSLLFTEQGLLARLQALSRRFKGEPRIRFAADAGTALALARYEASRPNELPFEALLDYANPFKRNEDEEKRLTRAFEIFRQLGLATIDDFMAVPVTELGMRFPVEVAHIWQRLREGAQDVWPPFAPEEMIVERIDLREPDQGQGCENLETLLFYLKVLVDRVMARLRGRDLRVAALELDLKLELGKNGELRRSIPFKLPLPQGSALSLMKLLHERLSHEFQRQPLTSPAEAMRLKVLETAPGLNSQADFFSRQVEEREAYNSLVDRLAQKLGRDKVYQARMFERYLPEASWQKCLQEPQWPQPGSFKSNLPAFLPRRPLWLLMRPESLLRQEQCLKGATGGEWEVVEAEGPERLAGEWLLDTDVHGFFRDYYRLVCSSGVNLWVFCVPGTEFEKLAPPRPFAERGAEKFFLHGYFD